MTFSAEPFEIARRATGITSMVITQPFVCDEQLVLHTCPDFGSVLIPAAFLLRWLEAAA
jgi:hypothetical protein